MQGQIRLTPCLPEVYTTPSASPTPPRPSFFSQIPFSLHNRCPQLPKRLSTEGRNNDSRHPRGNAEVPESKHTPKPLLNIHLCFFSPRSLRLKRPRGAGVIKKLNYGIMTNRKPTASRAMFGGNLQRLAERHSCASALQWPPRITRSFPDGGPWGFVTDFPW